MTMSFGDAYIEFWSVDDDGVPDLPPADLTPYIEEIALDGDGVHEIADG